MKKWIYWLGLLIAALLILACSGTEFPNPGSEDEGDSVLADQSTEAGTTIAVDTHTDLSTQTETATASEIPTNAEDNTATEMDSEAEGNTQTDSVIGFETSTSTQTSQETDVETDVETGATSTETSSDADEWKFPDSLATANGSADILRPDFSPIATGNIPVYMVLFNDCMSLGLDSPDLLQEIETGSLTLKQLDETNDSPVLIQLQWELESSKFLSQFSLGDQVNGYIRYAYDDLEYLYFNQTGAAYQMVGSVSNCLVYNAELVEFEVAGQSQEVIKVRYEYTMPDVQATAPFILDAYLDPNQQGLNQVLRLDLTLPEDLQAVDLLEMTPDENGLLTLMIE